MHDLRQRHWPIITPTLLCLKWPGIGLASLVALSIGLQNPREQ